MLWTKPMDAVLRTAWRDGHTAPQIAAMISAQLGEVSAGAVRGRRSLLGLPRRGQLEAVIAGKHKPGSKAGPPKPAGGRSEFAPDSLCLPWSEREFGQCAYPLTDWQGELLACAAPICRGARRPYCPYHLDLTRQESRRAA